MIRRTVNWLIVGVAIGVVGSMWLGPSLIGWRWHMPGQAICNCDLQVQAATQTLVELQLVTGGVVGILLAVVAHLMAKRRARAAKPA